MPMAVFEPGSSCVRSNCCANRATTTAQWIAFSPQEVPCCSF